MILGQAGPVSDEVIAYREVTFRTRRDLRLKHIDEAVQFVDERGFVFFWNINNIVFPSLWCAVAGAREVPNNHDDPAHITWDWKDSMLGKNRWFYSRTLRRKNVFISLQSLPNFYALSPNYGDYETDYLSQYQQGRLTAEAKIIYEVLLFNGPMDTLSLRKASNMSSESSANRFQRSIDQLQVEMKIMPVGVSQAGAWRYAFIYDLVPRQFPEIETLARPITELEARIYLLTKYLLALGEATLSDIRKMFQWGENVTLSALNKMNEQHLVEFQFNQKGEIHKVHLPGIFE